MVRGARCFEFPEFTDFCRQGASRIQAVPGRPAPDEVHVSVQVGSELLLGWNAERSLLEVDLFKLLRCIPHYFEIQTLLRAEVVEQQVVRDASSIGNLVNGHGIERPLGNERVTSLKKAARARRCLSRLCPRADRASPPPSLAHSAPAEF